MWYYNGEWNFSTGGCINAATTNWIGKQYFLDCFNECTDGKLDLSKCDINNTYIFILQHPEHRNIAKVKKYVYHIATRSNITGNEIDCNIGIDKPEIIKFDSFEQMNECLDRMNYNDVGYIICYNNSRYKLHCADFIKIKNMKGNTKNMTFQLLTLYNDNNIDNFLNHFPEYHREWAEIQINLNKISKKIYYEYHNKFVKKQDITFTKHFYPTIRNLHESYLKNKTPTTPQYVHKYIMKYPPNLLTSFISKNN
tara:strand:- start:153 stop:911 length:759 start_codon:yes stop_codon:yes gene_type:complete